MEKFPNCVYFKVNSQAMFGKIFVFEINIV